MTEIKPVEQFYFNGTNFVARTKTSLYIRLCMVICFASYFLINPNILGASFPDVVYVAEQKQTVQNEQDVRKTAVIDYILSQNSAVTSDEAEAIYEATQEATSKFNRIEDTLMLAVAQVESTFNKYAISHAGAVGVTQVIPRWHMEKITWARKELGNPEIFDIRTNIHIGAWILQDCLRKTGVVDRALLCYNGSLGTNSDYAKKVLRAKQKIEQYV